MKRFLLWFLLILVGLVWFKAVSHHHQSRPEPPAIIVRTPLGQERRVYLDRLGKPLPSIQEWERLDQDDRAATAFVYDDGRNVRREPAEGLPVPVVPGSRTTEARAEPPSPPRRPLPPAPPRPRGPRRPPQAQAPVRARVLPEPTNLLTITGRLSANEERARKDARLQLERMLAERLSPEVPRSWKIPPEMVDRMIREVVIVPHERDYGTVYEAILKVDFSPRNRAEIVAVYHRQEVVKRLVALGMFLAFVLVCLAAVSGYIKADEATRGYYTNRLRLAATAGIAAAGVALYRWLA